MWEKTRGGKKPSAAENLGPGREGERAPRIGGRYDDRGPRGAATGSGGADARRHCRAPSNACACTASPTAPSRSTQLCARTVPYTRTQLRTNTQTHTHTHTHIHVRPPTARPLLLPSPTIDAFGGCVRECVYVWVTCMYARRPGHNITDIEDCRWTRWWWGTLSCSVRITTAVVCRDQPCSNEPYHRANTYTRARARSTRYYLPVVAPESNYFTHARVIRYIVFYFPANRFRSFRARHRRR